jgi:hypothetical protein
MLDRLEEKYAKTERASIQTSNEEVRTFFTYI